MRRGPVSGRTAVVGAFVLAVAVLVVAETHKEPHLRTVVSGNGLRAVPSASPEQSSTAACAEWRTEPASDPTGSTKGPRPNSDDGFTIEQRDSAYRAGWASFEAKYKAWLTSPCATSQDVRQLPRYWLLADYLPGAENLSAAVRDAELIVVGTATNISFEPYRAIITFEVESVQKGSAAAEVSIVEGGGLHPTQDWGGASLSEGENAPVLLPGDRALLFLASHDDTGRYNIQSFSGFYRSIGKKIVPLPGNRFAGSIDGQSENQFRGTIASLVRAG